MKKVVFLFCMLLSISSCAVPSYSTYTNVSEVYDTPSNSTYITYNYEYYYNGVYTPVIYVGSTPWFYYHGVWDIIPSVRVKYIRHRPIPIKYRVHKMPPRKPIHHHSKPSYKYKPSPGQHRPNIQPRTSRTPNHSNINRTTTPRTSNRGNVSRSNSRTR